MSGPQQMPQVAAGRWQQSTRGLSPAIQHRLPDVTRRSMLSQCCQAKILLRLNAVAAVLMVHRGMLCACDAGQPALQTGASHVGVVNRARHAARSDCMSTRVGTAPSMYAAPRRVCAPMRTPSWLTSMFLGSTSYCNAQRMLNLTFAMSASHKETTAPACMPRDTPDMPSG